MPDGNVNRSFTILEIKYNFTDVGGPWKATVQYDNVDPDEGVSDEPFEIDWQLNPNELATFRDRAVLDITNAMQHLANT